MIGVMGSFGLLRTGATGTSWGMVVADVPSMGTDIISENLPLVP